MAEINITEGWSGPVDLQLQADGTVYDLTGKTVAFILRSRGNVEFVATTSGSQLEQVASSCGIVRFTPSSGDLAVCDQPYTGRVRVTSGTQSVFFPNGRGDDWHVFSQ